MNINKKKYTYLDWASAAPVSEPLLQGFVKAMNIYANPSSPHGPGAQAKKILEDSRKSIARITGVKTDGVIFTSGATEANALAIQGHVHALLAEGKKIEDLHMLYLPTSHSSVVETMRHVKAMGAKVEALVLKDGAIDLEQFKKQLRPETVLVSMDLVCGETGTKFHTRDVHRALAGYPQILLHVDASQAAFTESLECNHLGADLLTLDAQKVGGIRGIGVLVRANTLISLTPIVYGGGQEFGLRPGTENPALAASFAVALQNVQEQRDSFSMSAVDARKELVSTVTSAFPDAVVNVGKESVPYILNISFPGRDTDYAVMLLSEAGYAVSTKSACETDAVGSRVVLELTGDEERAISTVRISWGPEGKPALRRKELRSFAQALIQAISFLDSHTV
jgi:cysteine desulfurase